MKYQIGTSSYGGRRYQPYVFTEQGVAMLSAVLKSKRAVDVSIQIVRVFVKLRELLLTHKELREKVKKMEQKYDKDFKIIFKVLARFMATDPKNKEKGMIGFEDKKKKLQK